MYSLFDVFTLFRKIINYSRYREIRHRKGREKYVEFHDLSSYTIIVKFDILRKNVEFHDFSLNGCQKSMKSYKAQLNQAIPLINML